MSSISLGVAALVAIDSFSTNIVQSVKDQSRALMGGDISFNSSVPFTPAMDSLFDSLSHKGISFARVTTFPSMAVVPRTAGTRPGDGNAPGRTASSRCRPEPRGRHSVDALLGASLTTRRAARPRRRILTPRAPVRASLKQAS